MRLVIISDTHEQHAGLGTLSGDVLIHCGDFCRGYNNPGTAIETLDSWFEQQEFAKIIFIGGNHDFEAQRLNEAGKRSFRTRIILLMNQ